MSDEHVERCLKHPHHELVLVTTGEVRSHQTDYPTRLIQEWRCPACG